MTFDPNEFNGPIVRDKRRIDPETGQVRQPQEDAAAGPNGVGEPAEDLDATDAEATSASEAEVALAERTADLQRIQAEYVNYKKRVDRDREVVREAAAASTLSALLPVLDDIGRAREHDELTGGFKAVAESFERIVAGLGLVSFGEVGEEFDPRIHEALMHSYSDDVDGPVCQAVLQVGYRLGERIVRPARVAVAEPSAGGVAPGAESDPAQSTYDEHGIDDAANDDAGNGDPGNDGEPDAR